MRRMFEIEDSIEAVLADPELLDRETGELTEAGIAALDDLHVERKRKLLAVARYAKGERAESGAVKEVADGLAKRARTHQSTFKRLKAWLEDQLRSPEAGEEKIRDDVVSLHWSGTDVVEILEPERFVEGSPFTRTTTVPDLAAIKAAIKGGGTVDGARLVTRRYIVLR